MGKRFEVCSESTGGGRFVLVDRGACSVILGGIGLVSGCAVSSSLVESDFNERCGVETGQIDESVGRAGRDSRSGLQGVGVRGWDGRRGGGGGGWGRVEFGFERVEPGEYGRFERSRGGG